MSPKTGRRSRQGLESRLRIIEATFEIAAELGYAGTSIGKVSERSGLPASSVYWHFANKDELFAEVIQHSFDEWNASFADPVPPADQREQPDILRQNCRHLVASISSSPEFWRLGLMLALECQAVEPTARRRFLEIRRVVLERLADFWRAALPPPSQRQNPELPGRLARFTMATSDGIFVAAQAEGGGDLEALAELLADSLEALACRHG